MFSIYYSASVRGNNCSKETIKSQINILSSFGKVLTEHLGSDDVKVVDMGKTDESIYAEDEKLLKSCDFFVANVSVASLGVGFMISQAIHNKKPVLCLYYQEPNTRVNLSAMINGCPYVSKKPYYDDISFKNAVNEFLCDNYDLFKDKMVFKPKKIFLVGPPGSGKSTVAYNISNKFNLVNISTGQILRDIVKQDSPLSKEINSYISMGQLVPANIMDKIVIDKLNEPQCLMFGFVLDGYPPSLDDLQNLRKAGIYPDLVFKFECSDETAVSRQCKRGERVTDNENKAKDRMLVYHRSIPDITTLSNSWYPNSVVVKVDAEKDVLAVDKFVSDSILNLYSKQSRSYFPIPPFDENIVNSTRFHLHIDSDNYDHLREIMPSVYSKYQPAQGNIKIYPIHYLKLGPQLANCDTYHDMINFHSIDDKNDEAFVTGRLGDNMDYKFMSAVLSAGRDIDRSNKTYMIELEQYIGEWCLKDNEVKVESDHGDGLFVDVNAFNEFNDFLIANIPPIELHLGFNIPKCHGLSLDMLPISLDDLMSKCKSFGFNNGGWFIFKNDNDWVYRSNEFSFNGNVKECKEKLFKQAYDLRYILSQSGYDNVDILFSLEYVHGIWNFPTNKN